MAGGAGIGLGSALIGGGIAAGLIGNKKARIPEPSIFQTLAQFDQFANLNLSGRQIREQARQFDLLSPFLFEAAGFRPIVGTVTQEGDPADIARAEIIQRQIDTELAVTGGEDNDATTQLRAQLAQLDLGGEFEGVTGFEQVEPDEFDIKLQEFQEKALDDLITRIDDPVQKEIAQRFNQRTLAALNGELPVAPGLIRGLEEQERDLKANLRDRLGPGFETSSAGIEALANFQQRKIETLDAARRGDLTLSTQLGAQAQSTRDGSLGNAFNLASATEAAQQARIDQTLGRTFGVSSRGDTIASMFGNLAQGFNPAISAGLSQQGFAAQLSQFNAGQRNLQLRQLSTNLIGSGTRIFNQGQESSSLLGAFSSGLGGGGGGGP